MNKIKHIIIGCITLALFQGCGIYSFSGISISPEVKTFQVNFFQNQAARVNPGIDVEFTNQLQDIILNQTNLNLVTSDGDIVFEGEITQDYVAPNAATSDTNISAAQNRLTIAVNLRFYDSTDPKQDLEQRFSFFSDFPASQSETLARDGAVEEIFERITQDIFNATLARW